MVDFSFTEEQELFRSSLREWLEKNLPLEKVRENDEKERLPRELIKGIADLGLLCMTLPEEHGGVGADWVTTTIAAEELGYADISIALPVFFLVQASWATSSTDTAQTVLGMNVSERLRRVRPSSASASPSQVEAPMSQASRRR